jgi:hypothetical protein
VKIGSWEIYFPTLQNTPTFYLKTFLGMNGGRHAEMLTKRNFPPKRSAYQLPFMPISWIALAGSIIHFLFKYPIFGRPVGTLWIEEKMGLWEFSGFSIHRFWAPARWGSSLLINPNNFCVWLITQCKISEPYDNPFLEKSNLGGVKNEREKKKKRR